MIRKRALKVICYGGVIVAALLCVLGIGKYAHADTIADLVPGVAVPGGWDEKQK